MNRIGRAQDCPAYPKCALALGQIVGSYIGIINNLQALYGFLLSGGTYTTIDPPGSISTQPNGINDAGQIVGTYEDASGRFHGFLLSGGNYTTIDVLGSTRTEASGINNAGQIVGTYHDVGGGFHAFLNQPAPTTLGLAAASGTYGGTTSLTATLTSNGSGVSRTVMFSVNNVNVGSAITNSLGVATLTNVSLAGVSAGTYIGYVSAYFAGDSSHDASPGISTLTVNKAPLTSRPTTAARPTGTR